MSKENPAKESEHSAFYSKTKRLLKQYETVADAYFTEGALLRGQIAELRDLVENLVKRINKMDEQLITLEERSKPFEF
jgi:hypothetical protein